MNDPGGNLPDFSSSVPVSGTELFYYARGVERLSERFFLAGDWMRINAFVYAS
jgi:hypothetical protein